MTWVFVQKMGLEPTRSCDHRHLKPARLPIPPLLRFVCTVPNNFSGALATIILPFFNRDVKENF